MIKAEAIALMFVMAITSFEMQEGIHFVILLFKCFLLFIFNEKHSLKFTTTFKTYTIFHMH